MSLNHEQARALIIEREQAKAQAEAQSKGVTHWANPDHSETITAELKAHNLSMGGAPAAAVARYTIALGPVDGLSPAYLALTNENDRLRRLLTERGIPHQVELSVWYGAMPESNGKTNWTAILHRKGEGLMDGVNICLDRSEYPDRVRYEADRMRYLIGELQDEPDMLAYDEKLHSGYVKPSCATCQDHGVIGWTTGQTPESFDQGEAPCPECTPAEPIELFESVIGKNPAAFLQEPVYQVTESEVREFAAALLHSPADAGAAAAVKTLAGMGYTYNGAELWRPPLGKKPDFDLIDDLRAQLATAEGRYTWFRQWFLDERPRMEIDPYGYMRVTTPEIVDAAVDEGVLRDAVDLCSHGEEKKPGACDECAEEYQQMRADDRRGYENRG